MISLPQTATMGDYQTYIHDLETLHGWLDVDLVHNCFFLGEEMGELFKGVRRYERYYEASGEGSPISTGDARAAIGEEIVDVLNYLLAIANRLEIDVETAFRSKNARNQTRTWTAPPARQDP